MSPAEHDTSQHSTEGDEPLGPVTPDDATPLGDTPEAHDELSPHDLPPGHPGRQAAEEQAGGRKGTTRGHEDPSDAAPDGARS